MDKTNDALVMVNFSRSDFMLLRKKHSQYADLQGQLVPYSVWCEVMDCLMKLSSKNQKKQNYFVNMSAQTEIVSVD